MGIWSWLKSKLSTPKSSIEKVTDDLIRERQAYERLRATVEAHEAVVNAINNRIKKRAQSSTPTPEEAKTLNRRTTMLGGRR